MTTETPPSVREALEAAAAASEASAAETAAPEATAPQTEAPDTAETTGPARDANGRFASKATEAAPEEEDDYDESVGLDRDTWKLTPAQARERAKALAKERADYEARVKQYEPLDRVLGPRRDALRATWGDEGRAIEQLFHLSDWANRDFAGFVRHLAEQRGVDLRNLVTQQQPQQPGQPEQPADLTTLARQEVARIMQEERLNASLQAFDADASKEFRHDAEIRRVMGGLLQSGAAADLDTAYQMACKAHPTISAKLAERESAERAKREREEAARRAAEKAAAAASVRGAPGTARASATPSRPLSVRELLEAGSEQAARV